MQFVDPINNGKNKLLLKVTRRRKLQWFGHTTSSPGSLAHYVMHGRVEDVSGRGRPKRTWLTDIAEQTGIGITAG